jgi:zinc protease
MTRFKKFMEPVRAAFKVAIVALAVISAPLKAAYSFDLELEEFTLPNGMRFVLIPDKQSPAVLHTLWYRVGAADEQPGKSGLAHYLEHLMFRGTSENGPGEYFGQIDKEGAEINAFTTRDYTVYNVRMHKALLPIVMKLEADRMRNLNIRADLMETERQVVKSERREKLESSPVSLLDEQMDSAAFVGHPYGQPVVGYMNEVEKLTADDAQKFYDTWYHPNNVVAVIAGNLDIEELRDLAEEFYASVPSKSDMPQRSVKPLPAKPTENLIKIINPTARTDTFLRNYPAPSFSTATGKEALALDFLSAILANGTQGRLVKKLVLDDKIAADVDAGFNGFFRQGGEFLITAVPSAGVSPEQVATSVDSVVADIIANGVTEAEVKSALRRARASRAYLMDSQSTIVELVGLGIMSGWDGRNVLDFKAWDQVTVKDVQDAARKYLATDRSITGILVRQKAN